jgi:RNA methyltransferase, RsmD family
MRVITGSARGMKLETLKGEDITRPTSQMIKEAMFSAVQFYIAGARVLDIFSGSGQLGIEALSRGALNCAFVDQSREACDIIKTNLKKTGLFQQARVSTGDAVRYLEYCKDVFDIVFVDPPYGGGTLEKILPLLEPLMSANGHILCESETSINLPETVGTLQLKKSYRHGTTTVWLYRKTAEE